MNMLVSIIKIVVSKYLVGSPMESAPLARPLRAEPRLFIESAAGVAESPKSSALRRLLYAALESCEWSMRKVSLGPASESWPYIK